MTSTMNIARWYSPNDGYRLIMDTTTSSFELSDSCEWILCSFNEALLYCFSLNINGKTGWRLPDRGVYNQINRSSTIEHITYDYGIWIMPRDLATFSWTDSSGLAWCIPVRDLTNV